MREIPAKVVFALSAEVGVFVGMGIIVFHTIRVIETATRLKQWKGFRSL